MLDTRLLLDIPPCIAQTQGMFTETIDRGFYILTAVSGTLALAFAASLWFA